MQLQNIHGDRIIPGHEDHPGAYVIESNRLPAPHRWLLTTADGEIAHCFDVQWRDDRSVVAVVGSPGEPRLMEWVATPDGQRYYGTTLAEGKYLALRAGGGNWLAKAESDGAWAGTCWGEWRELPDGEVLAVDLGNILARSYAGGLLLHTQAGIFEVPEIEAAPEHNASTDIAPPIVVEPVTAERLSAELEALCEGLGLILGHTTNKQSELMRAQFADVLKAVSDVAALQKTLRDAVAETAMQPVLTPPAAPILTGWVTLPWWLGGARPVMLTEDPRSDPRGKRRLPAVQVRANGQP